MAGDERRNDGGDARPERDEVALAEAAMRRERDAKRRMRGADRARRRQLRRGRLRRHGPMLVVGPSAVVLVTLGLIGKGPLGGLGTLTGAATKGTAAPRQVAETASTAVAARAGGDAAAIRRVSPSDTAPPTGTAPSSGIAPSTTTTTEPEIEGRSYGVGDCVIWDQSRAHTDSHVVGCGEPHLFEVTGSMVMSVEREDYPTQAEWDVLSKAGQCHEKTLAYAAGRLDPFGRFGTALIKPTEESWRDGDREVWCGIATTEDDGRFGTVVGRALEQDQSYLFSTGTCLGVKPQDTTKVPCEQPHVYEVTGSIDLTNRFRTFPADGVWDTIARTDCVPLASQYLGRPYKMGVKSTTWSFEITAPSWNAGSRRTTCVLVRVDTSGNAVVAPGSMKTG